MIFYLKKLVYLLKIKLIYNKLISELIVLLSEIVFYKSIPIIDLSKIINNII
jgi:hypothetical protein